MIDEDEIHGRLIMAIGINRILLLGIVALGIFLRFYGLDRKVYWYDEAFTSLEVSGYTPREATADILTGRVVSRADLEKYQFMRANSGKSTTDTIRGLISNEPQLTPAYFVTLRWWSLLFSDSIRAIRTLSALFSVIAIALAYWLCREIFPSSPRVAYVCAALIAISPYHLLYAQEARPYSMWIALTLLSSVVLIKATRQNAIRAWFAYTLCAALSLYTFLLTIVIIAFHGLYVSIESKLRITATIKAFALSGSAAILAFLIWPYRGQRSGAGNDHFSVLQYATKWIRSIAVLFADFNLRDDSPKAILLPYSIVLIALLTLCAYSIYFISRHANRTQACFVLILIAALCLPFLAMDAITGSSLALVTRYCFPSLVGLQIALAYLLASKTDQSCPTSVRRVWQFGSACIFALELASCVMIARADVWWNKEPDNYVQAASRVINAAKDPVVVISDTWFISILSLEHKLRPDIQYQLTVEPELPEVARGAESIFAVRPSAHLRSELGKCFSFEAVRAAGDVWSLRRSGASCGGRT